MMGECLGDRCVVGAGYCAASSDCDDGETCTKEVCDAGRCVTRSSSCSPKTAPASTLDTSDCKIVFSVEQGYKSECPSSNNRRATRQEQIPDDLKTIEERLARSIAKLYRYDVKLSLVALPDGSFNIVVLNRRPPTEIRGMVDPSFIAWQVADFTAATSWRSRNLHIWTKPYKEGWALSTWASRDAVRRARAESALGAFGILDAPTFRAWLEKHFQPLTAQALPGAYVE